MLSGAGVVLLVLAGVEYSLTGYKLLIWGFKNLNGCVLNEKDLTDHP